MVRHHSNHQLARDLDDDNLEAVQKRLRSRKEQELETQQQETPAAIKRQVLKGAYVQAWLWVEARDPHDDPPVENPTDDDFRRWAKGQFESEGEVEIDSGAVVSRSYDDAEEEDA